MFYGIFPYLDWGLGVDSETGHGGWQSRDPPPDWTFNHASGSSQLSFKVELCCWLVSDQLSPPADTQRNHPDKYAHHCEFCVFSWFLSDSSTAFISPILPEGYWNGLPGKPLRMLGKLRCPSLILLSHHRNHRHKESSLCGALSTCQRVKATSSGWTSSFIVLMWLLFGSVFYTGVCLHPKFWDYGSSF